MGFFVVIIVGTVMGWLAAIIVDRDDRIATIACLSAGLAGAVVGALVSGDVPLVIGVSAAQLLWGALGAAFAIICVNAVSFRRPRMVGGKI